MTVTLRSATAADAAAIQAIYAPYVRDTAITFEYEIPSVEDMQGRIEATLARYPYLVAEEDGQVIGYAYAGEFKGRRAYDWSVEVSIYLQQGERGRGIGRMLYEELERRCKDQGICNLYACIAYTECGDEYLTNASVKFHEKLGFDMIGVFHKCAYKFDRWYDMCWMEKRIGEVAE